MDENLNSLSKSKRGGRIPDAINKGGPHKTLGQEDSSVAEESGGACLEVLASTLDRTTAPLFRGRSASLTECFRKSTRSSGGGKGHRQAGQISRINPGDQQGDRCCGQIALTSTVVFWKGRAL